MKIRDYKNLNLFIELLFEFLEGNRIKSSLMPVQDYRRILDIILDSEFSDYVCNNEIGYYTVHFKVNQTVKDSDLYMFLFGEKEKQGSSQVMIEMVNRDGSYQSSMSLSWYEVKLPPLMEDFRDEKGMLKTENYDGISEGRFSDDEIMTFDEFKYYLMQNKSQKYLKHIYLD